MSTYVQPVTEPISLLIMGGPITVSIRASCPSGTKAAGAEAPLEGWAAEPPSLMPSVPATPALLADIEDPDAPIPAPIGAPLGAAAPPPIALPPCVDPVMLDDDGL